MNVKFIETIRMFPKEFHFFVVAATIIYYMMLKNFKSTIQSKMKPRKRGLQIKDSNFVYLIFLPIILYIGGYILLYNTDHSMLTNAHEYNPLSSDSLLSAPYPRSDMS
jgi:hypothetical protein